jgi:heme A synthase
VVALAAAPLLRAADARGRAAARACVLLILVQLAAGLLNVLLLAPVWMQLVHLLLADLAWIAFVLMAVRALTPALELSPSPAAAGAGARAVPDAA